MRHRTPSPSRPALSEADWVTLNRLLERGIELDEAEQAAWLATLPAGESHLRDLLESLLAAPVAGDPTLDPPFGAPLMRAVAVVAAQALAAIRPPAAGERIGPWRLQRLIAEGGMGAVWLAERADGVMQRTAALKLPRADWVDRDLADRIARERAILARLKHADIATLFDAGITAEGRPYLALEFVDGVPIDRYCAALDLPHILRLYVRVTRAVAYAHAQLVIHRDIKPANVLVTADGAPKLLDFGISKLVEHETPMAEETALTRALGRRLTLAYAAPEQILGQPITVAADVYALGAVLFELLTGRRCYTAADPRALESQILVGEPPRPSAVAGDPDRARALRGDLDAILLTALRRDPAQRYQSAGELADDIERHLARLPVRARPDSRLYRLRRFAARNALPLAAGAAVLLALGIGLAAALWQAQRATALTSFVMSLIRYADPNASPETRASDLAMLAAIENRIDHEFRGSPDQLLELRLTVGDAYRNRGEMMAARRVFQRAIDEAAPRLSPSDLQLLRARVRASDPVLIVSTAASEQLDGAIEALRGQDRPDADAAELLIDALLIRSDLQMRYGLPAFVPAERRLDTLKEAQALAVARFGAGSRQHLRVVFPLGWWTSTIEGGSQAHQLLESALQQARDRGDGSAQSPEYLAATARLHALACEHGSPPPGAADAVRQSIEAVRAAHGPHSVLLEDLVIALGRCQRSTAAAPGDLPAVQAYAIARAREQPPSIHLMQRALGAFQDNLRAGRYDAAQETYLSVIENAAAIPEAELRERLTQPARMGQVCLLARQGRADEALRAAAPLAAYFNGVYAKLGRLTPGQGDLWPCLSNAQLQLGQFEAAGRTLETFIERCRTTKLSPQVALMCEGDALIERALLELETGQPQAALVTVERRLAMARDGAQRPRLWLVQGRGLLANGRATEALEPLRQNYAVWQGTDPEGPYAAEALYWLSRAELASGDASGRQRLEQARQTLTRSPVSIHRRLAAAGA